MFCGAVRARDRLQSRARQRATGCSRGPRSHPGRAPDAVDADSPWRHRSRSIRERESVRPAAVEAPEAIPAATKAIDTLAVATTCWGEPAAQELVIRRGLVTLVTLKALSRV
eukprot:26114-Chlamydomonas_euryale.AAC.1